jgi:YYY domain-containing protein
MFFDWIGREGGSVLSWWLLTLLAGVAVYPLFFRLMSALPSRGYALARAAGLMLVGFVFWLLGILGLLDNTPGSTVLAALIVFVVGLISYATWREREPILPWLRRNMSLVVVTEILFVVLFVGWASLRALNPNLTGTEKPMEMAFLSAIRRSATFPPHDPWMSGYAISYYHFGYIIMAMIANMSGVTNGVAFNLALPLLFALTGVGAFGVAYDLVAARVVQRPTATRGIVLYPKALATGLLAAVFAVVMGNLGTALVEIPYQTCTAPAFYLKWMNIEERNAYSPIPDASCATANDLDLSRWNNWWWFRYSRVVRDADLSGRPIAVQPITEFPQFSFVLSDMHPHVLALPFAVLSIGLAANLVMRKRGLYPWEVLLYGIFVGGMVFLNSFDAVYLVLVIGAEALRRLIVSGTGGYTRQDWRGIAIFGVVLVVLMFVLYLPFFISFRSQVQGVVPNVIWPTQFQQFFLMFGPFMVMIGVFLAVEARRAGPHLNTDPARRIMLAVVALIVLAFLLLMVFAWLRPELRGFAYQTIDDSGGLLAVIPAVLLRRLQGLLTEGLLLLALFVVIARLFARQPQTEPQTGSQSGEDAPREMPRAITYSPSTGIALLLIAAGAVLTLFPDLAYLQDGFGTRINTVFKLYFQGWLLWSIASAYALWSVLSELPATVSKLTHKRRRVGESAHAAGDDDAEQWRIPDGVRLAFAIVSAILIIMGLVYPLLAIQSRYFVEAGHSASTVMTLEGGPSLASGQDDYNVIQCLARVARSDNDVVAEAVKPNIAYNTQDIFSRVSGLTGIPTLIGWDNHEKQWRGSTYDQINAYYDDKHQFVETRQEAIARLYNTTNWDDVRTLVKRYGITYIYVGPTERRNFDATGLAKFETLTPVCSSGDVAAYSVASIGVQTPPASGN